MEPVPNLSGNLAVALTAAAASLALVARGTALDRALDAETGTLAAPERAAAQDIAYTACRRLNLLDAVASRLMKKPNPCVDYLIRVAVSELIDHAAERAHVVVDQAVRASSGISEGAFKGLVNGVLRTFLREQEALLRDLRADDSLRLGYPRWWLERIREAWPAYWEAILEHGNHPPPMTLRVNLRRNSVEAYADRLAAAGLGARRTGPAGLTLERPLPVSRLPGFAEGLVSVQDLGAQWAAHLLCGADVAAPGEGTRLRVLDACAAPGGKTAHLLESIDCEMLALDRDAERLVSIRTNLARLGLSADCRAVDAIALDTWWDGVPFDLVLLDAPCTASGVISRHPDGKWLKRAGDLAQLARLQRSLLEALWRVLKPGGKLLYATCSLFPQENTRQVDAWLGGHPDARRLAPPSVPTTPGAPPFLVQGMDGQILPGPLHNGFFYALLAKA